MSSPILNKVANLVGHWEIQVETGELYWSDQVYQIHGFEPGGIVDVDAAINVYHPDDRSTVAEYVRRAIEEKEDYQFILRLQRADGEIRHVQSTGVVRLNPCGEVQSVFGVFQDVTDQLAAEDALKRQQQMLEGLVEEKTTNLRRAVERFKELSNVLATEGTAFDAQVAQALETCCRQLGLETGIVSQITGNHYKVLHFAAPPDSLAQGQEFPLGNTYCELTMTVNDVLSIDHMKSSAYSGHPCYQTFELESYIGCPYSVGGKRYGTVNFASSSAREAPFDELDRDFVRLVANWVGSAIERQNVNNQLQENEERFRGFAEVGADRFWEMDSTFRFTSVYEVGDHSARFPTSEMIGKTRWQLRGIDPNDDGWRQHREDLAAHRPIKGFIYSRTFSNGERLWIKVFAKPLFDADGGFLGYRGTNTNVTEEVEASLVGQRFFQAMEELEAGFILWDSKQRLLAVNSAFKRLLGEPLEELKAGLAYRSYLEAIAERSQKAGVNIRDVDAFIDERIAEFDVESTDREVQNSRGIWVRIRKHKLADGSILSFHQDITDIKRNEDELLESQSLMRRLMANTVEGYWDIDLDAVTRDVNPAMCVILERSREEIIGRSIYDFVDAENADVFRQQIEARKRGDAGPYEIELLHPDGTKIACVNNATPVVDSAGNPTGSIGLLTDISGIKNTLAELELAKSAAEKANNAKSEFLSSMSHELRTPMNSILGFGQLLMSNPKEPLTDIQREQSEYIIQSGHHLLGLIDQVLELSKIESEAIEYHPEHFAPSVVLHECREMLRSQADEQGVTMSGPEGDIDCIYLDPARFKQIILNLMSNGIKYNQPGGSVSFGCRRTDTGEVRVYVSDSGDGIPVDRRDEVFIPFNRLGRESSDIIGTGIGLTITKRLIEAMGGKIGFDSIPGEGTTFWMDFPQDDDDHRSCLQRSTSPIQGQTVGEKTENLQGPEVGSFSILYVEDNPANMKLMETIIRQFMKVQLHSAHNAELGFEMARRHRPTLILMDINLPGMDGVEAYARLQEDHLTSDIPVIALTASAMPAEVERITGAGFDDVITKPIQVRNLMAVLSRYFGKSLWETA